MIATKTRVMMSARVKDTNILFETELFPLTKVRPKQIWQDRAFNLFAICLAYELSASLKVKCDQVWPMIII